MNICLKHNQIYEDCRVLWCPIYVNTNSAVNDATNYGEKDKDENTKNNKYSICLFVGHSNIIEGDFGWMHCARWLYLEIFRWLTQTTSA